MKIKTKHIVIGGLALVGILTWWMRSRDKSDAMAVETAVVQPGSITETVMASGTVRPEKEVKISPEVSGEIIELRIKDGQFVHKGDLLLRINPDLYQSALERARASLSNARAQLQQQKYRLELARTEFNRNKKLFDKGIVAPKDFEKSKTDFQLAQAAYQSARFQVQSAQANLNEARDNLKRTIIYAPIDGTVTKLNVEAGERVVGTKQMAGTEMLRIADLRKMQILAEVNENDIVKIHPGDSVRIEIEAFPNRKFRGIVNEIANSPVTAKAGTDQVVNFQVKIGILPDSYRDLMQGHDKAYSPFRPGMTATVEVITASKQNILSVPLSAVTVRPGKHGKSPEIVFVYRSGLARRQPVETGIQDEENIEIIRGLAQGDTIITGPYEAVSRRLRDSMRVKIATKDEKLRRKFRSKKYKRRKK